MKKAKLIASISEITIGIVLCICYFMRLIDEFWSGMGMALVIVGLFNLLRFIKYKTNEKYRENVDTETNDERNRFLSLKAWGYTGYMFVMIAAVATIVFKLTNKETLMMLSSGSICLVLIIYWITYVILKKKY